MDTIALIGSAGNNLTQENDFFAIFLYCDIIVFDSSPGQCHFCQFVVMCRECFVVLEEGADKDAIEAEIIAMPGYFEPYKTTVNFISQEELDSKYSGFPHDGCVVASGVTGDASKATIEYRCTWESNPEATANVLVAHARAIHRLHKEGRKGAFTILDIPPAYLSQFSQAELLKNFM